MKKRIYTGQELALEFQSNILTFNGEVLTFWEKGLTHFDVNSFTYNDAEMGESSIELDLLVEPEITPSFTRDWYIDFRGERFYLSTLEPGCVKDTTSLKYKYSLIFKSQRDDLDRYEFANFVTVESVPQPTSYDFTLPLTITELVERININLEHYFGSGVWQAIIDPSYLDNLNTQIYDGTSRVTVAFSRQTIWSIISGIYEMYGLRWKISSEGGVMTIRIGATPVQLSHEFKYGHNNGLVSVERVNANKTIYTRLSGKGSSRNLPYRYFDSSTVDYIADPDNNEYTRNIPYSGLMPASYRQYVKGWNAQKASRPADSSSYAYLLGYEDASSGLPFNPVDYAISSAAEEKYGVRKGSIEDNAEIFPTLQGTTDPSLGRLDEIVAVEAVLNDNYNDTKLSEPKTASASVQMPVPPNVYESKSQETDIFSISETSDISFSVKQFCAEAGMSIVFDSTVNIALFTEEGSRVSDKNWSIPGRTASDVYDASSAFEDVAPGSYYMIINASIDNISLDDPVTVTTELSSITSDSVAPYKQTFDVWIKNIWDSSQNSGESDSDYTHRVWDPLLTPDGDLSFMFQDGLLAGEDYVFKVACPEGTTNYYIYPDATKTLSGTQSHWRISLLKSDVNLESTELMFPNVDMNAEAGDHFFITNIEMPYYPYVYDAEDRLDAYLAAEIEKVDSEDLSYTIKPSSIFLEEYAENASIGVGVNILISDAKMTGGEAIPLTISALSIQYSSSSILPVWNVTVSERPSTSKNSVQILQGDVKVLSSSLASAQQITEQVQLKMDGRYLRRDGEQQISQSPTVFRGGIKSNSGMQSENFIQGQFGGVGYAIYMDSLGNSILEIDKLNVRRTMSVNELVINQISVHGGISIYSAAAMVVSAVDDSDGDVWKCYLDVKSGTVLNQFVAGDLAYCQQFSAQGNSIIKYYWKRVLAVGQDYIVLARLGGDGDGIPAVGDNIAQLGNIINVARQSALIIDQTNGGSITQYAGIDNYSLVNKDYISYGVNPDTGRAYERIYGDLYAGTRSETNYIEFDSLAGTLNVKGKIHQSSTVYDDSGNSAPISLYRGEYDPTKSYFVGNTVSYGGSLWYCNVACSPAAWSVNYVNFSVQIVRGTDGLSAVNGVLTNDAVTVPADTDGSVMSFSNANGIFKMFYGATDVTESATFSKVSESDCTGSISNSAGTKGVYAITAMPNNKATGKISMTGTYAGVTITRIFNVAKAYTGANGEEPVIYEIYPRANVIIDSSTGFDPEYITFDFKQRSGGTLTPVSLYSETYYSTDGENWTYITTYEQPYEYVTEYVQTGWKAVKCITFAPDGSGQGLETDVCIVRVVRDGRDGADGRSLSIKGAVETMDDLPLDASTGDAYLVTNDGAYSGHLFMYDATVPTWVDCGEIRGPQGVPGIDGSTGATLYTWVKYADSPTSGMSDDPEGKIYVGLAFNKTSQTESLSYADYAWSLIRGESGNDGALLPNRGLWSSTGVYVGSSTRQDCVKYPLDGEWYKAKPTAGTIGPGPWDANDWESFGYSGESIATDTLLADGANIAGFIYKNEKMISQSGTINGDPSTNIDHPDFVPNLTLDGSAGVITARNAVIQGTINASTGTFDGLLGSNVKFKTISALEDENAQIGFSNGQIFINGDLLHQGSDASGNGYIFYTQDVFCRGAFGSESDACVLLQAGYAQYYPHGLSEDYIEIALTSGTDSLGNTYYSVPLYGTSGEIAGFPVNTVIFKNLSGTYRYRLIGTVGKKISLINACNTHSSYFYYKGSVMEIVGGSVRTAHFLGDILYPAQTLGILGYGMLLGPEVDNNW